MSLHSGCSTANDPSRQVQDMLNGVSITGRTDRAALMVKPVTTQVDRVDCNR